MGVNTSSQGHTDFAQAASPWTTIAGHDKRLVKHDGRYYHFAG